MFRVVSPPIIRSSHYCIYSIWYYWDRYCCSNVLNNARYCRYSDMSSWWWVEIPPETCRAICRCKLYIVTSCCTDHWTLYSGSFARLQVVTAVLKNTYVFCDMTPGRLVNVYISEEFAASLFSVQETSVTALREIRVLPRCNSGRLSSAMFYSECW